MNIIYDLKDLRRFIPRFFVSIALTQAFHSFSSFPSLGWNSKHFSFTHLTLERQMMIIPCTIAAYAIMVGSNISSLWPLTFDLTLVSSSIKSATKNAANCLRLLALVKSLTTLECGINSLLDTLTSAFTYKI